MLAIDNAAVANDADGKNAVRVLGGDETDDGSLIGDAREVEDIVPRGERKIGDCIVANVLTIDVDVLRDLPH